MPKNEYNGFHTQKEGRFYVCVCVCVCVCFVCVNLIFIFRNKDFDGKFILGSSVQTRLNKWRGGRRENEKGLIFPYSVLRQRDQLQQRQQQQQQQQHQQQQTCLRRSLLGILKFLFDVEKREKMQKCEKLSCVNDFEFGDEKDN